MNKFRLRLLKKISQVTDETEEVTKEVEGAPDSFSPLSFYPSMAKGFSPQNLNFIKEICDTVNEAMYYLSDGKRDLTLLRSNNFNITTSEPDIMVRNLIAFAKQLYNILFINSKNQNKQYTKLLEKEELQDKIDLLKNSPVLVSLPSTNPPQLKSKFSSPIKTIILNHLNMIK